MKVAIPPLLQSHNFETCDFSDWKGVDGAPTCQSVQKHHGSYAGRFSIGSPYSSYCYKIVWPYTRLNFCAQIKQTEVTDYPTVYHAFLTLGSFPSETCGVGIDRDLAKYGDTLLHFIAYWWEAGVTFHEINLGITMSLDTWYLLEIGCYRHATLGWYRAWINKVLKGEAINVNTTGSNFYYHMLGIMNYIAYAGSANTVYGDCAAFAENNILTDVFG